MGIGTPSTAAIKKVLVTLAALGVFISAGCGGDDQPALDKAASQADNEAPKPQVTVIETVTAKPAPEKTVTKTVTAKPQQADPKPKPKPKPKPEPEQGLTAGQANALGTAKDYLATSAFSRSGLIEQLKFEGYSTADATYAVNHVRVNWNKQAAKSAKQYLDLSSFSRSGLITQLKFEGYTQAQAVYGVNKAGL